MDNEWSLIGTPPIFFSARYNLAINQRRIGFWDPKANKRLSRSSSRGGGSRDSSDSRDSRDSRDRSDHGYHGDSSKASSNGDTSSGDSGDSKDSRDRLDRRGNKGYRDRDSDVSSEAEKGVALNVMSSGLWVSTATGSTAVMKSAGGHSMHWTSPDLQ